MLGIKFNFSDKIQKRCFFPFIHFSNDSKQKIQFLWHPHIGETHTKNLVYEKGRVIKHIKAPGRVKVELPDL